MAKTIDMSKKITLAGFGDFSEDPDTLEQLKELAPQHDVLLYGTYYDYELEGTRQNIELITLLMWNMPRDQWSENLLTEEAK